MITRKTIIISLMLVLIVFVVITNYLFLSLTKSLDNNHEMLFVEKIQNELNVLPEFYKQKPAYNDELIERFIKGIQKKTDVALDELWREANSWILKTKFINISSLNMGNLYFALKHTPVIKANIDPRGTQLKLLLTLQGDQQVIFKPQWYPLDKVIEGPVYSGKDRFNSEIIAFYLSVLLNRPLCPVSVKRHLNLKLDVFPGATPLLLNTSFETGNRSCIYGKCYYCKKEDPFCDVGNKGIDGVIIFNYNTYLKAYRSPWQRTYSKTKKALWEENFEYCKVLKTQMSKNRLLDLIDVSIFDFLIQNGDRHHYEVLNDRVVFLDNGKGFGNPYYNHIDILAPLYQCCMLRKDLWKRLLLLAGGKMREYLMRMPDAQELITEPHLKAMEGRLLLVFATIEYCRKKRKFQYGPD